MIGYTQFKMKNSPIVIAVAPNGAGKTKEDHPNLPISSEELAREAASCKEAGATLIHLHVRDKKGVHTLDVPTYKTVIKNIRKAVKKNIIIQVTSEAQGMYTPDQQMDMIKKLKPEAVSVAIREFIPDPAYEAKVASFLKWMLNEKIYPQYVLYSDKDLQRFMRLKSRGIIPGDKHFVLFVLGRYTNGQISYPVDLLPFLRVFTEMELDRIINWSVCAFGKQESNCMLTSSLLGGHVRIGFENNIHLSDGTVAKNNKNLIEQFVSLQQCTMREVASIEQAKKVVFCS